MYATPHTAHSIRTMDLSATTVDHIDKTDEIFELMSSGKINYLIFTCAMRPEAIERFKLMHIKAMQLGIPCLTSLDTADALANMLISHYSVNNTELVDLNNMRTWRTHIRFTKMHSCGNDYIFIVDFDNKITCP